MKKIIFSLSFLFFYELGFSQNLMYGLETDDDSTYSFVKFDLINCSTDTLSIFSFSELSVGSTYVRGVTCGSQYSYYVGTDFINFGICKFSLNDGSLTVIPVQFNNLLPIEIEYNPNDNCIYSISRCQATCSADVAFCKIDLNTGIYTIITSLPTDQEFDLCPGGVSDFSTISFNNNKYYALCDSGIAAIDLTTGFITYYSNSTFPILVSGIFCDNSLNKIFGLGFTSISQFELVAMDLSTGVNSSISSLASGAGLGYFSYDQTTHNYTMADQESNDEMLHFTYNTISGNFVDSCRYGFNEYPLTYSIQNNNSVNNSNNIENKIQIVPTIIHEFGTIICRENLLNANFIIYNSLGEKVYFISHIYSNKIEFKTTDLPAGIYYYDIFMNDRNIKRDKIIIQ